MDLTPFFIEFLHNNKMVLAEIKPCCREDEVFYYDVIMDNQFQFTITPGLPLDNEGWKVSLKNADRIVDAEIVVSIGKQIETHIAV